MKRVNTSPISGMQELLPEEQYTFDYLKSETAAHFHAHGYQGIETPVIDRTEILLAKAGGDTEKQIYKVVKTAEAAEGADQALRFDHTVPLARYVVEHENDLPFPFKVTQIGRNFRGERAQKGRFREFYQCDIDVIGRGNLPVAYDADVIATLYEVIKEVFGLPKTLVRISNRKILAGFCEGLGELEKLGQISNIIDHAEKVPPERTIAAFEEIGLSSAKIERLTDFIDIKGPRKEAIDKLRGLRVENDIFARGVDELDTVLTLLETQCGEGEIVADMLIIRGLDYYTGTVFETFVPGYEQIGSICSGGRYENLASLFTEQKLPGVGGSIGLTRLFYVLNEYGLLKNKTEKTIDVAIIPISQAEYGFAFDLAKKMRGEGRAVDVVMTDKRLGDKMAYAAKVAKSAAVIGENEATSGRVQIKNLETGEISAYDA